MSDPKPSNLEKPDEKLGAVHENLQGWIPSMATEDEIRLAFDKAFDYRGDLTVTLKNGQKIEGYIFDRRAESPLLSECVLRMMPRDRPDRLTIRYSDIAALAFSGKDTAAGKSFQAWIQKYREKKARGEKNIGLEAEPPD